MRIEEIYDALFDEDAFAALPGKLAVIAGGRSAIVGWIYADGSQHFLGTNGYFRADHIARYLQDYAAEDPWTLANLTDFRPNILVDNTELVSDERYSKSRLYNEFFRDIGDDTFRALSVSSHSDGGKGSMAIHRGKSSKGFAAKGKQRLAVLAPHIGRVIALKAQLDRLARGREVARLLSNHSPVAGIIIDSRRRLIETNEGGEKVLELGAFLALKWGRVIPMGRAANEIERALTVALKPEPSPAMVTIERFGQVPLTLDVIPMPLDTTMRGAMLLVRDPAGMSSHTELRLVSAFGMSPAQAAVALKLAEGRTIEEIASIRGVSRETVRVQVRDVAARLGCSRQAEISAIVRAFGVLSANSA